MLLHDSFPFLLLPVFLFNKSLVYAINTIIVQENKKIGSDVWWYNQSISQDVHIYGFSTKISYLAGETASFKITSLKNGPITMKQLWIFRLGYYGGKGATLVGNVSFPSTKANNQPPCLLEHLSRLVDCSNWKTSVKWTVPTDSTSGVYVALPTVFRATVHYPHGKVRMFNALKCRQDVYVYACCVYRRQLFSISITFTSIDNTIANLSFHMFEERRALLLLLLHTHVHTNGRCLG
jgi:hypothetical protein